ncbi:MAG: hypothetical protein H7Y27_04565 [Gemmatimonadaceae bacterium]|nr:hypothetical protein [Chitinophagaceae bacterium]
MKKLTIILLAIFITSIGFGQKSKVDTTKSQSGLAVQSTYKCPMHSDVVSNVPGKCPKCNMDLTESKKEKMKKDVTGNFACPMHNEVVNDMAGTCAKCGKELVVVDRKGSKQGQKTYVCSMHPEVTATKSGKCAKCGMALTLKKQKKS